MNASAKPDVLAVMDRDALDAALTRQWDERAPLFAADSVAARAAVAELIEAAQQKLQARVHNERVAADVRLRAALVRVQGEQP